MPNSAFLAGGFTDLSIGVTPITGGVPYSFLTTGPLGTTLQQVVPGANGDVLTIVAGIPTFVAPGAGANWLLTGNAGTTPGINFLGTTDLQNLQIQTNSVLRMEFDSGSNDITLGDGATAINLLANGATDLLVGSNTTTISSTGSPSVMSSLLGATDSVVRFTSTNDTTEYFNGIGSPEGVVPADAGSWYSDTTNGTGAIYVKTTDTVNTGWVMLQATPPASFATGLFQTTPVATSAGLVLYTGLTGGGLSGTEASVQNNSFAGTYAEMRIRVGTNTHDGVTIIRLRVNGAAAGPSITIGAGAVGNFSDATAVTVAAGDLVNIELDSSASTVGSIFAPAIINKQTL